ncbi:MAG: glycoside hydrolase family 13 protein [Planctomycetota bacterium]
MARNDADPLRIAVLLIVASSAALAGCNEGGQTTVASEPQTAAASEASVTKKTPEPYDETFRGVSTENVPAWVADAIFYQIFPERFRNGDPNNDPTRESLEFPDVVGDDWRISSWTADWYGRDDWEKALGENFYDDGVFHRRYGGDLQGVIDKLDYVGSLGVNTLYFNPVFYGRSMHKYDGASMHHIDPYFGPDPVGDFALMKEETADPSSWQWTAADKLFLKLLKEAKDRGIRVIIDGVFNHTGRDFFAFADIREKQEASDYTDWYIVQRFDDPSTTQNEFRYKGWWGVDTLPEFANSPDGADLHPGPREYVMAITARWMDPNGDGDPSDGIDGWRLDVANEVPTGFWKAWNQRVREINPEAYTVAEIWDDALNFLRDGGFSATMNYHGFAYPVKGYLIDGKLTPNDFGQQLEGRRVQYPLAMQFGLQNLIDSHDTDRVASMVVNAGHAPYENAERFDYDIGGRVSPRYDPEYSVRAPNKRERRIQRLVALTQMTSLGAPMVYYGTEAGMWGGDDPCDRMPMVWEDLEYAAQTADPLGREREPDAVGFDSNLFNFFRGAISLRKGYPPFRRGTSATLAVDDAAQFYAFQREYGDEKLIVCINRGEEAYQWDLPIGPKEGVEKIFSAAPDSWDVGVRKNEGGYSIELPGLDAAVLELFPTLE